jgi:hypothetical protein
LIPALFTKYTQSFLQLKASEEVKEALERRLQKSNDIIIKMQDANTSLEHELMQMKLQMADSGTRQDPQEIQETGHSIVSQGS